ncbi:ATP-binding protein [Pseudoalteromonas sp. MMG005]|uniref:sensor histidine kinase n=1 Tax=Pseudoalteromonas sp. MMG005 TaxID=2822682 RepID=UPI001B3A6EF4|nr:ATP-binding protein [Pseudoalteromonas sp. MMG005]MBQ4847431.1 hypothetical protein [Pseudoalteromonas sp. MMG005]
MKHILIGMLSVILLNIIVASLTQTHLVYALDNIIFDQYGAYLIEGNRQVQGIMTSTSDINLAILKLNNQFDIEAYTATLSEFNQDVYLMAQLSETAVNSSFIDVETASIYYRIAGEELLVLGPIVFENTLTRLADWLLWLIAAGLNLLIALLTVWRINNKYVQISTQIQRLPITFNVKNDVTSEIDEIEQHLYLIQAQTLERINLQRDLLHGVAHEFRSPMARMQFALDMLEDAQPSEKAELTATIHKSLQGLDDLVKELLYYAKLKDGSALLHFTPTNLSELIDDAIAVVSGFYPHVTFVNSGKNITLDADSNLLKRLLVNILRNAGRFAHAQCNVTILRLHYEVKIYIEDDGIGIPPGKSERIFEPFTRLDPSRSRDSGGCGLGLAIAHSIAQLHRGHILVEEAQGSENALSGACFSLTLPLTQS